MYFFTSSTSVFPDISGQFDEGSQLSAETEIGKTLIQAEQVLVPIRKYLIAIFFDLQD